MKVRTIENPVTGERFTLEASSHETGGAWTIGVLEVTPAGFVPMHRHAAHDERIEVLEGEIEVVVGRLRRRLGPGESTTIARGQAHAWRNASADRTLRFRGTMTPGHPGFELFLRVLFGLARDGEVRKSGLPRRLSDLGLLVEWDPSILAGPARALGPLLRWSARRARARGRATELLQRYGDGTPPPSEEGALPPVPTR